MKDQNEGAGSGSIGDRPTFLRLVIKPTGFFPVLLSLAALTLVMAHAAIFGVSDDPVEGTTVQAFRLIMLAQLPIIAVFTVKWLTRAPAPAVLVIALQLISAVSTIVSAICLI